MKKHYIVFVHLYTHQTYHLYVTWCDKTCPTCVDERFVNSNALCTPKALNLRCANRDALGVQRAIYLHRF